MEMKRNFWFKVATYTYNYADMLDEKDARSYARKLSRRFEVPVMVHTMFIDDPRPRDTWSVGG